ncbi:MAG: phenylalanine--tRNA ligase subunit beta [Moraxellaceae bacterium]|nr:phenylalanine--tRNA ligase subunit beta [Moraxellaceae bacterium]MDZ4387114.1 phenylalanine--tRNA ligase subunit beta [Moraxellaceae bacterium]
MLFSEKHLRQQVNPSVDTATLAHRLTMAGLEVDAINAMAPPFTGVLVGEVVQCEQHPDADKLRVTQVNVGQPQLLQIVCGAANVRVGLKVPVATVGAVLPGDFRIKPAKLRGVASEGMLCAEQELGLAELSDGLWELPADAPIGQCLREYLNLDDQIIELGITPNRGDCLSLRGLARETAAIFELDHQSIEPAAINAVIADSLPITLAAPTACPRYVGRVIRGIQANAVSPAWLVEALKRHGVRSLHPVVDVTNWVMLSLGQPMHAFDLSKVSSGISVRLAHADESLVLLDEQEINLLPETLVIADDKQALALAGIMGGKSSSVEAETVDLFLEAAFFAPLSLAGQARRYGLHTDSSHRFERGVDPALPQRAIELATQLIIDIVGGQPGPCTVAEQVDLLPKPAVISLRRQRIAQVLGFALTDAEVAAYLTRLGMQVSSTTDGWQVVVPSHRFDISIEIDLIEELARLYGYNRLPVTAPTAAIHLQASSESTAPLRRLKQVLVDLDYQEAITFSFVEPSAQKRFDPAIKPLALANPISADLSVMRTSLWPGLVQAVKHNQARQQARVRLFESGLRFVPGADGLQQEPMLAGIAAGANRSLGWTNDKKPLDFYDVKGNIETLLEVAGVMNQVRFVAAEYPALHPGQSANVFVGDTCCGLIGALHPSLINDLDLEGPVYVFELSLNALQDKAALPKFKPLSRFPDMRRDFALVVADNVAAEQVIAVIKMSAGEWFQSLQVFDLYRGRGVNESHYSLAVTLVWQHPERTLQDTEVQAASEGVITALSTQLGVVLRG